MRTANTLIRRADAQVDLNLRWAHQSLCLFCHAAAQLSLTKLWSMSSGKIHVQRSFREFARALNKF